MKDLNVGVREVKTDLTDNMGEDLSRRRKTRQRTA